MAVWWRSVWQLNRSFNHQIKEKRPTLQPTKQSYQIEQQCGSRWRMWQLTWGKKMTEFKPWKSRCHPTRPADSLSLTYVEKKKSQMMREGWWEGQRPPILPPGITHSSLWVRAGQGQLFTDGDNVIKTCICHFPWRVVGQDLNHNTSQQHPYDYKQSAETFLDSQVGTVRVTMSTITSLLVSQRRHAVWIDTVEWRYVGTAPFTVNKHTKASLRCSHGAC